MYLCRDAVPTLPRDKGQGRREGERLLSEGSRLDFDDGLSDEGAFLIVMSDGTGVKRAGGVAVFRAAEGQEKAAIPGGLRAQFAEQRREVYADFERAFIAWSGERDFADVVFAVAEERPAVEGLR